MNEAAALWFQPGGADPSAAGTSRPPSASIMLPGELIGAGAGSRARGAGMCPAASSRSRARQGVVRAGGGCPGPSGRGAGLCAWKPLGLPCKCRSRSGPSQCSRGRGAEQEGPGSVPGAACLLPSRCSPRPLQVARARAGVGAGAGGPARGRFPAWSRAAAGGVWSFKRRGDILLHLSSSSSPPPRSFR